MLSAVVPLKQPCILLRGVRERLEVKINNHRSQSVNFLHMPCYEGQGSGVLILDCPLIAVGKSLVTLAVLQTRIRVKTLQVLGEMRMQTNFVA